MHRVPQGFSYCRGMWTACEGSPRFNDAVPLFFDLQETSCGQFAAHCVSTTARIIQDAAACMDVRSNYSFVRNFTPKPLPTIEVGTLWVSLTRLIT